MIQEAILEIADGNNLSLDMTKSVMNAIMSGEATNAQIASFITATYEG